MVPRLPRAGRGRSRPRLRPASDSRLRSRPRSAPVAQGRPVSGRPRSRRAVTPRRGGRTGGRVIRSPLCQAPPPRSATYAARCCGCQIHPRTTRPYAISVTIDGMVGRAGDEVLRAVHRVDRERVRGLAEHAPAATGRRSRPPRPARPRRGRRPRRAAVIRASASWSATVTRSPGPFSVTCPAARSRNRGVITSSATSWSSPQNRLGVHRVTLRWAARGLLRRTVTRSRVWRHGVLREGRDAVPPCWRRRSATTSSDRRGYADREALVEVATGRRWTWAELDHDVDEFARGLLAAGIDKGDRVGIWSPNCAEWTLVQYATAKVGAILVNVNPAYRTHELAYALNQSGVRLLISATDFKTSDYRSMIERSGAETPALERVVFLGTDDWAGLRRVRRRRDRPERTDVDAVAHRPHQHPVHLGNHGPPEGRHPVAPQHPQQRVLHDRADQLHRATTGCASRCPSTTASAW